jgi:hypothetical protein
MKRKLLGLLLVLGTVTYAQVGVGTLVPNESAILDVVANNKGLLIPRVSLKSTKDLTTISSGNVESLLVYNTELIQDVRPGYYYWADNKWNKLVTSDDSTSSGGLSLVDNTDGTFTFTNDKGVKTVIDVPAIVGSKTKNSIASTLNTLTSNVNGNSVSAPIVNTNVLSAKAGQLISTVNGVDSNSFDLKAATTNSLLLSGGVLTSAVNGIAQTANVLATVSNGLSTNAGNVKLGGTLKEATSLNTTATETLSLSGLQPTTTAATDNVVVADAITGVLKVLPVANLVSAITTKTTGYTALPTDETILVDASATSVTITLPEASSLLGKKYNIKKIDTSDNNVNIRSLQGMIDTVDFISGGVWLQSWTLQSDGANWFVINRN